MTTWFTSDHHFGHANIIEFCKRPFNDVTEMNEKMINRWNSKVMMSDLVYYLGDFTLNSAQYAEEILKQLNGSIVFIPGGHDHRWIDKTRDTPLRIHRRTAIHTLVLDKRNLNPIGVINDITRAKDFSERMHQLPNEAKVSPKNRLPIVMCHYPMASWEKSHYGSIHLHGHVHNSWDKIFDQSSDTQLPPDQDRGVRINVCVDVWDFYPVSLEEVLDIAGFGGKLRT